MLEDVVACNARNHFPGTVYNNAGRFLDLHGGDVLVDYRGYEVNVENFIRVLTGGHDPGVPGSKRLFTDDRSNILVYMTGHGGDEFLKFQDFEEISSHDLSDAFSQMWEKRRYHEILFVADTCQAASLYSHITSPNILSAASSLTGESSYSHHGDTEIGVHFIDRFTYYNLEVLERVQRDDVATMQGLFNTHNKDAIASTPGIRKDLFSRTPLHQPPGSEKICSAGNSTRHSLPTFLGGVQTVEYIAEGYTLQGS
ncbi:peptidase C13 family-domain-containing protein [Cladochytrium replicatum]|nr:peptidase C13 family-domain-containing protein [Cladochytrium replicatum]